MRPLQSSAYHTVTGLRKQSVIRLRYGGRSRWLAGRLYPRRSARAGDLLEAVAEELVAEIAAADEHRRIEGADVVFLGPADRAAEAAGLAPGGRRRLAAALLAVQAVVQPVDLVHGETVGLLLRAGRPRGRSEEHTSELQSL